MLLQPQIRSHALPPQVMVERTNVIGWIESYVFVTLPVGPIACHCRGFGGDSPNSRWRWELRLNEAVTFINGRSAFVRHVRWVSCQTAQILAQLPCEFEFRPAESEYVACLLCILSRRVLSSSGTRKVTKIGFPRINDKITSTSRFVISHNAILMP
jgi:hypothetical protein